MIYAITSFFASLFSNFWSALSTLLVRLLYSFREFIIDLTVTLINLWFGFLRFCFDLLPDPPEFPKVPGIPPMFEIANYYIPVSEALLLVGFILSCYAIRASINFARFVRGGG